MTVPEILLLFTQSYPYDVAAEQTFLAPEIATMARQFRRVIVVPECLTGKRYPLPAGVELEERYASFRSRRGSRLGRAMRAGSSSLFFQELWDRPWITTRPACLRRLANFVHSAELTRRWVLAYLGEGTVDSARSVFYTFWCDASTLGIGLCRREHPCLRLISRAHRYDLYEQQIVPPYIPLRPKSLFLLDALFPDSLRGADHVARLYPWFAGKTFASRQGVDDPGFITSVSSDGVFRVVSCAAIIARKRLDLTLRGVALAARSSPRTTFEWNHIGDGPLRGEIEAMAKKELPANVVMHILGYLPPEQMMEFYRDNAIDVFITTTESEGTPVSLMEAAACGMAVVATDVGGNPEVVSERNGVVLDAKPSPTAVAAALLQVLKDPIAAAAKRQESRRVWQERYDAKRNYMEFAERIKAIPAPRGVAPAKPDRSAECGLKSEG